MKVASVVTAAGTKNTGETLLLLNKQEGQEIMRIVAAYCDAHKRDGKARKIRAALENMECF